MKLKYIIEISKKLQTGLKVKFKTVTTNAGTKAMSLKDENGKKYVIGHSLENYVRFQKWEDKKAIADIKPTGKKTKLKDGTKLPLVKIRADVEVEGSPKKSGQEEFVI